MATDSNDPMIEVFKNICKFYKLKDEPEKGIDLAIDLLQQDDFFIYLPMISDFMGKNSLNKAFHLALASFPAIKNRLLTLLDKTKTPFGKLQLARSLYDFSLISIDDYTEVEKNTLISHLKPPLSVGTLDAICNLDRPGPNNLEDVDLSNDEEDYENIKFPVSPGELDSGVFKDKNAIVALACLKITNNELLDRLYEVANSGDSYDLRNAALDVLLYSEKRLDKLISQCRAQLKEGRSQDDKMSGLLCLLETGHADDNTLVEVEKIIKSNKNLNIWVQRPTGNIEIGLLESSKFKSYEQVKYFFNLVLKQNLEKREENKEIVSIGALAASLPIEEAKMFLADSSISDYEKCKYFEEAFGYDIFIFNENFSEGKMTKMPMALLPKYMDLQRSILLNKRDDSIIIHDYYALSYLDLQNEEDETFLIELIKKEKNKPSNLISNLPLETVSDVIAKFIVEEYHIVDYGYSEPFDNLINYLDYRETLNEKEKVVFRELLENIPNVPIKTKARLKELGVNIN
ncbi:MAG: hypothetical protein A2451_02735 [Bdellovibrionales bacterium RIFOXYC2_FULL_39_8]|nr:MAG: hypothetical protein A2451_02735 [Bdellovibrionales bacterium RIFOXYC2_FULL_39_8]